MKKLSYIILFLVLSLTIIDYCHAQWVEQQSNVTTPLRDIQFVNANTGWSCGDAGVILKTTNAGTNWVIQATNVSNPLQSIYPVNDSIVYCVGWFETILKTTNGGNNWHIIENGPFGEGHSYFTVFFLNETTGWISTTQPGLRKTTNGGQTFSLQPVNAIFRDLYFKDSLNSIACSNAGVIGKTTNGGDNWEVLQICTPGIGCEDFKRISFVDHFNGFVVGGEGTTYKTTNYGISWDSVGFIEENFEFIFSSEFYSDSIGWAGGTLYMFKTTNGGVSWRKESSPSAGYFTDIFALNDTVVWACGNPGVIYHTTTGGDPVGINIISSEIPEGFDLKQNFPNPFNPSTTISYDLRNSGAIELLVYSIHGKIMAVLVNQKQRAGSYQYIFNAGNLTSGVYFYQLKANGKVINTRKMILLK